MADVKTIEEVIGMNKQTFDAMNRAMNLYSAVDKIIPWEIYDNRRPAYLYCFLDDYSSDSTLLIRELQEYLLQARERHEAVVRFIREGSCSIEHYAKLYVDQFKIRKPEIYEHQLKCLIKMLTDGLIKFDFAQSELAQCCMQFNNAAEKLKLLVTQLTKEFDTNSSYFQGVVDNVLKQANGPTACGLLLCPFGLPIPYTYGAPVVQGQVVPDFKKKCDVVMNFHEKLEKTIAKTSKDMESITGELDKQIKNILKFKDQAEDAKVLIPMDQFDELREAVLETAKKLMAECIDYEKNHRRK